MGSSYKYEKDLTSWDHKRVKAVYYTLSPNEVDPIFSLWHNYIPTYKHWWKMTGKHQFLFLWGPVAAAWGYMHWASEYDKYHHRL